MYYDFEELYDLVCSNSVFAQFDKDVPLETMPSWNDPRFKREQTVFGVFNYKLCNSIMYSDRLIENNYQQHEKATERANASDTVLRSAHWYELYLSVYFNKVVEIIFIRAGVNQATGYPYCVFGFKGEENEDM